MNNKCRTILIPLLVVLIGLCSVLVVVANNFDVNASISNEIADYYTYGDTFTVPTCTFDTSSGEVSAVSTLVYPSGKEVFDDSVTLNESGKYTLKYYAESNGITYTKEYDFIVKGRLAKYSSARTSTSYELCTNLGANSTGLSVRLASGDSISFDHVFDMSSLTNSQKIIELFVNPDIQGVVDFTQLVFTFTDIENPAIKLIYHANYYDDPNTYGMTYVTCGGENQIQTGREFAGRIHTGTTLGCPVPHSFMAMDTGLYWGHKSATPCAPDEKLVSISYDALTNQGWAGGKIVADMDSSEYYTTLWNGFQSGKAQLTISATGYQGATANFVITQLLDVDLSQSTFEDNNFPTITINNNYETMPDAKVGYSYPIPTATAFDSETGTCEVKTSVWFNYDTEYPVSIDFADGRFNTNNVGTYAIVYEATDGNCNTSREVLWVKCKLGLYFSKIALKLNSAMPTTLYTGEKFYLPTATPTGGSGEKTVSVEVMLNDKPFATAEDYYLFEETGVVVVTYLVSDYTGDMIAQQYAIVVQNNPHPVLASTPILETCYISDATYTLPQVNAIVYSDSGNSAYPCDVKVECNGKTTNYKSGDSFVPSVSNDLDEITITYLYDNYVLYSANIPVRIVWISEKISETSSRTKSVLHLERYFYTEDDLSLQNKVNNGSYNGMMITSNSLDDKATLSYIKSIVADDLSMEFYSVPSYSNFKGLEITLTDSVNKAHSVTVKLVKGDSALNVYVGTQTLELGVDLDGTTPVYYSLAYSDGTIVFNNSSSLAITSFDNGDAFNGFDSGCINFAVSMLEPTAESKVFLYRLCKTLVSNTSDNTGATIGFVTSSATICSINTTYNVPVAYAVDMLCPSVDVTVTVYDPLGNLVRLDDLVLENVSGLTSYPILLNQYGEYIIRFESKETNWKQSNTTINEYNVLVVDDIAPAINFSSDFQSSANVGDMIYIPSYTVSDNYSDAQNLTVLSMITSPSGAITYLYDGKNAVKASVSGTYKIDIFVYDEIGNVCYVHKEIKVK